MIPKETPPLTKSEAEQCLYDLITKTATALQELHSLGYAHLDVRLPNICFAANGSDYHVKLIDLDRAISIELCSVEVYIGEYIYKVPGEWSPSRCDWKQLGLLAAEIIFKSNDHSSIVNDHRVDENDCLKKLIRDGRYLGSIT